MLLVIMNPQTSTPAKGERSAELIETVEGSFDQARRDIAIAASSLEFLTAEEIHPIPPLTPLQVDELKQVSLGTTVSAQENALGVSQKTVGANRHDISEKLGVKTIAQAVRISIEAGIIPIEVDEEAQAPKLKPRTIKVLSLISEGLINEEIAQNMKVHRNTVVNHVDKIKQELTAENRPHAVRRAFETGVFELPDTKIQRMRFLIYQAGVRLEEADNIAQGLVQRQK